MSEWIESALADLAIIVSGGTPSREVKAYWEGEIPWVTPTDITACKTNYLETSQDTITKEGLLNSSAKLLPAGSILVTSRASIGLSKITLVPVATNQGFKSLIPKPGVDALFLFYQTQRLRGAFERFAAGSTFLEINKKDTERIAITHPRNIVEQRKISAVLTAIVTAIEKTEALIAKYQKIKAGLMHDLFTRGVLPNGQLRPPRSEAPELYHETAIGWIPKEWKALHIEELCAFVVDCPHSTPDYEDTGYPCIRTADLVPGELMLEQAYKVSARTFNERILRLAPKAGDIIYSREGERLGIASPVGIEPVCLGQRVMLLRPAEKVFPQFLMWAMNMPSFYRRVVRGLGATTSPHINVGDVKRTFVPTPAPLEQQRIGTALATAHEKVKHEQTVRNKLISKKRGLMQDLLTGKVPVQVDKPDKEVTA